jgi:hypothetical protein
MYHPSRGWKNRSLFNVQLSFVIFGGASRVFLMKVAPEAHP